MHSFSIQIKLFMENEKGKTRHLVKQTITDTILTINGKYSYHMETQMYKDEEIEFRVFDYGYRYALKAGANEDILTFPEPQIIQLYRHSGMPDTKALLLDFDSGKV